jgi:hypothetical protein
MPETTGTCALCSTEGVALRESHILPTWAYRRVVGYAPAEPDPVLLDGDSAMFTSRQSKVPLLCDKCEQRFGSVEQRVSDLVVQANGRFPLLAGATEVPNEAGVVEIPEASARDLAYFGLSVVWRADVAEIEPVVSIPPARRQSMRSFLAGQGTDPGAVVVLTMLAPPADVPKVDRMFTFPETAGNTDEERHEFICCGVRFSVITGPVAMISHGVIDAFKHEYAFVSDARNIARTVAGAALAATARGKLSKRGPVGRRRRLTVERRDVREHASTFYAAARSTGQPPPRRAAAGGWREAPSGCGP